MSDKKLEDYMKDLDAYAKADAKQKKVEYEQSYKKDFVFPWTKVILGSAVALWAFHAPLIESAKTLVASKHVQDLTKLGQHFMTSSVTNEREQPTGERTASSGHASAAEGSTNVVAPPVPSAAAAEMAAKNPNSDMIRIEGRWVKRSPDNIYYIDGRRILYIDNRVNSRQQAAPAPATETKKR